jgi:acetylornithine deacetylase
MKGFVACCLAAAPSFAAAPLQRPIHLALSYDEEIGCFGVPQLIADLLDRDARTAFAIIGEPTGMAVGDRHRGFFGYRTTFHGSAAHSSNPAAGASAIYPAAALISLLQTMAHTAGDGTNNVTFNVGRIHGGSAINIVPSACEVHWEFRPAETTDVAGLTAAIDTFLSHAIPPSVRVDHKTTIRIPQLNSSAYQGAVVLAHELGGTLPTIAMPFGTEAGYYQGSHPGCGLRPRLDCAGAPAGRVDRDRPARRCRPLSRPVGDLGERSVTAISNKVGRIQRAAAEQHFHDPCIGFDRLRRILTQQ